MKRSPESNPFLEEEFSIPIKRVVTYSKFEGSYQKERSTSEVISQQRDSRFMDLAKNTKVFRSRDLFSQFLGLSGPAKNMFMYLLLKLPASKDYLEFRDETFAEMTGKSVRTVREWRGELKWLMKPKSGRKNMYWINPAVLFNGNRVKYFPEYYNDQVGIGIEESNEFVSAKTA